MLKLIKAVIRGILKGLPITGAAVEARENVKALKEGEPISAPMLREIKPKKLPHEWISIIFQVITAVLMLYGLITGVIDLQTVVNFFLNTR